jgi:hypothetical protein
MSAPLVINLRDGSVWERRAMTAAGVALYALAGSCKCPEYLMASESELAAQGIAGTADVLPVPAGPEPRTLDKVEDELTGANLSLWEEEQETARLRLAFKSAKRGRRRARNELEFTEASRRRWRDGLIKETAKRKELERRVAELLVERHSTNESLDDALKALRADRDRIAELEAWKAADEEVRPHREASAAASMRIMAKLDTRIRQVRFLHTKHRNSEHCQHDGERWPCPTLDALGSDGVTKRIVPVHALREDEPATKCRCGEPGVDPYACEAEDCTHEFSELNPFGGGSGPVEGHDAKVSRTCGCGWQTSVWHVADGSAEEELHGHVVRAHGGVYPAEVAR